MDLKRESTYHYFALAILTTITMIVVVTLCYLTLKSFHFSQTIINNTKLS